MRGEARHATGSVRPVGAGSRGVRALVALAAVLAATLAGCAGIPTGGPVVAGPEVGLAEPDFAFSPSGPQADASPRDLLAGFMLAVRAPQADFQVAREFLTRTFAKEWDPDAGTLVRSGTATTAEALTSDTASRVDYTFNTVADIDDRGRYREVVESSRTLSFAFVREDGQWRISAAPPGIVLSQAAFSQAFTESPLYFLDPSGRFLVPDVRWFAARTTTPNRVVEELLAGPTDWLQRVVFSDFPAGTTLGAQGVEVRSGRAVVDLSAEAGAATPQARAAMHAQLAATLGVGAVEMTAEGVPLAVPDGSPAPVVDPQPSGTVLVGTGGAFGFGTDEGVVEIEVVSPAIVADGGTAATLTHDQTGAAYLGADGAVRYIAIGDEAPAVLDEREGLVAPGLDPFGFVWSAERSAGGALLAISLSGTATPLVPDSLSADTVIQSITVSRDGARLLVTASSATGSRVLVYGIVRADGVPTQLTGPLELLPPAGAIIDAAWVDDQSVVVLAGAGSPRAVVVPLGGPSVDLGVVVGATEVVGGRGRATGIRVLADGHVFAPTSGRGWNDTGITARFLGTQQ